MAIRIEHPGVQATIQDLGRIGVQKYGISVSGVMDTLALRIANLLLYNNQNEAAIEVMFFGTSITFAEDQVIAITGGNLQPVIDGGIPAPMWRPILMKKGSNLTFKGSANGCFTYVAVAGGFSVQEQIGSKSTYIRAGIGGYKGRALQEGDEINIGGLNNKQKDMLKALRWADVYPTWYVNYPKVYPNTSSKTIRVLQGNEYSHFTEESQRSFSSESYTLTTQADRMGYKFTGKPLQRLISSEILSEGVTQGTIQVPENGQPIILMADRQTTGGYPKIGQVISADLPKLAQMQPNSKVSFRIVSMKEAERAFFAQENHIKDIALGIYLKMQTGGIAQ